LDIREDKAWLLQSRINPFPVSGALALINGRISFVLDAMAAEAALGWLEQQLETEDLKKQIEAGEKITAFDHSLEDCQVSWPLTGGGSQMLVKAPERKWVVSYDYPSGGAISNTMTLISGRKKAKEWKKALAEAENT
jgi:hypothetical protein